MTLQEVEVALTRQSFCDRYGDDAVKVRSLVGYIRDGKCPQCAWRRYAAALKEVLELHGDTLDGLSYRKPEENTMKMLQNTSRGRIPCLDCVKKHINQAFILCSEVTSGYLEYRSLAEAHLTEAFDECPPELTMLRSLLTRTVKELATTTLPVVPREALFALIPASYSPIDTRAEERVVEPLTTAMECSMAELTHVPVDTATVAVTMLEKANEMKDVDSWEGLLACTADMLSPYAPMVSNVIRNRRLLYKGYIEGLQDASLSFKGNQDILEVLKTVKGAKTA